MHETTGTRDVTYDVVSVLHHALQEIAACAQYAKDARDEGKPELAAFFEKVMKSQRAIADEAKGFLRERLAQSAGPTKDVDQASNESFPASDATAVY